MTLSKSLTTILLAAATLLQGCGTGIDVTERVSAKDVRREVGELTPEQRYLADVTPEPIGDWRPGKRFHVTDDKIKLMLGNTAPTESLQGKEIVFKSLAERMSPTGSAVTDLTFATPEGKEIVYTASLPLKELESRGRVEIPFAVEMSIVDEVARRMTGNTYYVLVADRMTTDGANTRRRKFIPVTAKIVLPGNSIYPIAVILTENDTPTAPESMVYMNPGSSPAQRSFASLFSLTDPRLRYPHISNAAWQNIVRNRIEADMTRDECRLALGSPVNVDRLPSGGYIVEIWTYDNGTFLRFEDGLLKTFRQ